ncbi:MAG: glycoside hydrolase family 2 protein [Candidatus Helarchaeota archaeon]
MKDIIFLNGKWKYSIDEDNVGDDLGYWKHNYDDSSWKIMEIPSNWYLNGVDYNGVIWFRYYFNLDIHEKQIIQLIFQGIDYYSKVWINDYYLGDHEGYFGKFKFNITDKILKKNNIIVVKCCAPYDPGFPMKKKLFKGGLVHWDLRPGSVTLKGQEKGSGGIWQPVYLKSFNNVGIEDVLITPIFQNGHCFVNLDFKLINYNHSTINILIKAKLKPFNFSSNDELFEWHKDLKSGSNEFHFKLDIKKPQLWWTWDLGSPNLYILQIEIFNNNNLINNETIRFGIRKLEEKKDSWYLNGVPIFLRGSCYFSSCWLSEMTKEKFMIDIKMVKEANMNILRLGYHVEPQIFYEICDELGILIWQDFPMLWDYDVNRVKEACRQMKELVIQFYNHPCIVIWCCHCEPIGKNQIILDLSLKHTIQSIDKSNRVIFLTAAHAEHPFVGWYYSTYYNFLTLPGGKNPNEFGAESLPNSNSKFWSDLGRENWWPINKEWAYRDFQKFITLYLAEILKGHRGGITLRQFINYSQKYQAELLKFGIEAFRRGKGKIHGIILFTFNDAWPSITWSIVDYYRNPKLAYYTVKKVYQPLHCSVELPTLPIPNFPNIHLIILNLRELCIAPLKAFSWNNYFTRNSKLKAYIWTVNDYNREFKNVKIIWKLILDKITIFKEEFPANIPPSSSNIIKRIEFKFSKEMKYGEYLIKIIILDKNNELLSENELKIYLCSKWKKVKNSISRFFGIYKGYLSSFLGQEIQIKMILNSLLNKYKKLARKSWCLE